MELGPLQKKWVTDLREHAERQTDGVLGRIMKERSDMLLCCLGQAKVTLHEFNGGNAADLFRPPDDGHNTFLELRDGPSLADLPDTYEELGLYSEDGLIISSAEDGGCNEYGSLVNLNDSGVTWPEIADFIEQKPERVFAESK